MVVVDELIKTSESIKLSILQQGTTTTSIEFRSAIRKNFFLLLLENVDTAFKYLVTYTMGAIAGGLHTHKLQAKEL